MQSFSNAVARVLDLAVSGDLAAVETALGQLQQDTAQRRETMTKARHDLGNMLSIAQASVEAMLDGVAPITDARLNRIRELLQNMSVSLHALTADDE